MSQLNLVAPQLTNPIIWFPNTASFNSFMSSCYVTITDSDLPVATTTTYGAVKQATLPSPIYPPVVVTYVTINDGDGQSIEVPSKDAYDNLKATVVSLNNTVSALITALEDAGIMVLT